MFLFNHFCYLSPFWKAFRNSNFLFLCTEIINCLQVILSLSYFNAFYSNIVIFPFNVLCHDCSRHFFLPTTWNKRLIYLKNEYNEEMQKMLKLCHLIDMHSIHWQTNQEQSKKIKLLIILCLALRFVLLKHLTDNNNIVVISQFCRKNNNDNNKRTTPFEKENHTSTYRLYTIMNEFIYNSLTKIALYKSNNLYIAFFQILTTLRCNFLTWIEIFAVKIQISSVREHSRCF